MTVRVARSLDEVDPAQWNALLGRGAPFLRHEFLLGARTIGLRDAGNRLGRAPPVADGHARPSDRRNAPVPEAVIPGANSYSTSPGRRPISARGSTITRGYAAPCHSRRPPARGCWCRNRMLAGRRTLIGAARELDARAGCLVAACAVSGSWRITRSSRAAGLMPRLDCQFHWRNDGYGTFEDFLAGFTAEKRKKLRRERRRVAEAGITHQDTAWRGTRRGTDRDGITACTPRPSRTLATRPTSISIFSAGLARTMPRALVVELATLHGEVIACSVSLAQ